jgi:hypothetical protein
MLITPKITGPNADNKDRKAVSLIGQFSAISSLYRVAVPKLPNVEGSGGPNLELRPTLVSGDAGPAIFRGRARRLVRLLTVVR